MTKQEAIKKLKHYQSFEDYESGHWQADNVLCEFLNSLGYEDVVKEFEKVGRWYA